MHVTCGALERDILGRNLAGREFKKVFLLIKPDTRLVQPAHIGIIGSRHSIGTGGIGILGIPYFNST